MWTLHFLFWIVSVAWLIEWAVNFKSTGQRARKTLPLCFETVMNFEILPPRVCRRLVAQEKWWINCWDELQWQHAGKLSIQKWLIRESERKWHHFFIYIYYLFGMISSACPLRVLCAFHIKLSLNAVWWHAWNPITRPSNYMSPLSTFSWGFLMGAAPLSDPAPAPLTLPLPILACHRDKLPHVTVGHTPLPNAHAFWPV